MITNTGKDIIGKFMAGVTDTYASHIAIGCGSKPISSALSDYSSKTELDFEMARFPIISRGYVADKSTAIITAYNQSTNVFTANNSFVANQTVYISGISSSTGIPDGGYSIVTATATNFTISGSGTTTASGLSGIATVYVSKIVLTAEIPTEERYEITELGLYPNNINNYPSGIDSRVLFACSSAESWNLFKYSSSTYSSLSIIYSALDAANSSNNIDTSEKAFVTNADNSFFNSTRIARFERPRFYSDTIVLAGDLSTFTTPSTTPNTVSASSNFILLSGINIPLSKNSTNDVIKVAYSIINKNATPSGTVDNINIMLKFKTKGEADYASYHFIDNFSSSNRYDVMSLRLDGYKHPYNFVTPGTNRLTKTSAFSWDKVYSVEIYASVQNSAGTTLPDYSIILDAVRFDNVSNNNPLYGLTAYTVVKNSTATPLIKNLNSSNLVEFRIPLGIQGY